MQKYKEKYTNPEICSGTYVDFAEQQKPRLKVVEHKGSLTFSKYKYKSMSRKKGNTQTAKYQDCRTAEVEELEVEQNGDRHNLSRKQQLLGHN